MPKRIVIILGHPACEHPPFCAALAKAYQEGAAEAGHLIELVKISALKFDPVLHEGYKGTQPLEADIADAQAKIGAADHLVFVYPLWQFMIPALLKGFMERVFTPGFAYNTQAKNPLQAKLLKSSARLIQTMGMPVFFYRFLFQAHGAKALRDILKFCGIHPVKMTYFGMIENVSDEKRRQYLAKARELGRNAQ